MDGIAPACVAVRRSLHQHPPVKWAWVTVWIAGTLGVSCHIAGCGAKADTGPRDVKVDLTSLEGPRANRKSDIAMIEPQRKLSQREKADLLQEAKLNYEAMMNPPAQPSSSSTGEQVASAEMSPVASETTITDLPAPDATASAPIDPVSSTLQTAEPTATEVAPVTAPVNASTEPPTTLAAPAPVSTDPLIDLATRMANLLRTNDPAGKPIITDLAAILPVESLKPGVLATLADASSPLATLSSDDKATLVAARDRLLADPSNASNDLIKSLRPSSGLSILRTALCTRVEGFGRFDPYSTSTFVQGRTLRAIVYVELDGFATRPARDSDPVMSNVAIGDQVSVDLTQSLSLFHDADDLLAWHRPARGVIETSRNKRRDFYLIQQIDLPPTLTVGRYNLKVTVTDRTTQGQAEAIIPIEIVAHESALRGR